MRCLYHRTRDYFNINFNNFSFRAVYGGYRTGISTRFDFTITDFIFENVSNDFLP